jgi:arylsulfatase A-like enzyme
MCQVDLPASFAALTGQNFDAKTSPDSENTLPALMGDSAAGRKQLVEHAGGIALRSGEWKFIPKRPGTKRLANTDTETGNDPEPQLYRLTEDLGERRNLASAEPEKVKEFATALRAERAKAGDALRTAPPAK